MKTFFLLTKTGALKSISTFIQRSKKPGIYILLSFFSFIVIFFLIPTPEFEFSFSTVLQDYKGNLLGALIADDSQWRFPPSDAIPAKLEKAILTFEDKNFYYHHGVDFVALARAVRQNLKAGKVVSGGSTITMQLVRLSRKGKQRNLLQKCIEVICAIKTDLVWRKKKILCEYASYAPFGGNVVGISAASWRYFSRDASKLSWAESALLAVLPNHPAMMHPGRNRDLLRRKRNRLLLMLYKNGTIDQMTYELALQEELPLAPQPLPQTASHLLHKGVADGKKGVIINTSINLSLQLLTRDIINRYNSFLKANGVHNGAAIILDVETGKVLAYVGNTSEEKSEHNNDVDIISSARSYGSLIKPFLYASMIEEGELMPDMLIADIPTNIGGYSPQNFNKTYDGSVAASKVLSHSLNVPSVRMLQKFGTEKFLFKLKNLGMDHLTHTADHYGLSIILGGGESTLWELTSIYGNMSRKLAGYDVPVSFTYDFSDSIVDINKSGDYPYSKSSVWCAFEALSESRRPGTNGNWETFYSSQKIAWKTGTSFGLRDAWSIGVTPKYVVGVWFGNADGEGRAGLTGIGVAAPAMFELFNQLEAAAWFKEPVEEMVRVKVCVKSGHKATGLCEETIVRYIPKTALRTVLCPYHIKIFLDKNGKYRVNSGCEQIANMQPVNCFVLPPIQEWYYKTKDPHYKSLPPFRAGCERINDKIHVMEIIYPGRGARIYIPREISGKMSKIILEAAHRRHETSIYWHLDGQYLGETHKFHQMECFAEVGSHKLTIIDVSGEVEEKSFEVIEKGK